MKKNLFFEFLFMLAFILFFGCIQTFDIKTLKNEIDNVWLSRNLELPFKKTLTFTSNYLSLEEKTLKQMQREFEAIKERIEKRQEKEAFIIKAYIKINAAFVEFLLAEKQAKENINALNETTNLTITCIEKNKIKKASLNLNSLIEKANEFNNAMHEFQENYSEYLQEFNVLKDNYLKMNKVNETANNLSNFVVYLENICGIEEDLNNWAHDFNIFVISNDLCNNKERFNELTEKIKEINEKTLNAINAIKALEKSFKLKITDLINKEQISSELTELEKIKEQLEIVCEQMT